MGVSSEVQGDLAELQNALLRDLAATIVTNVSGEPPRLTAPFEDG